MFIITLLYLFSSLSLCFLVYHLVSQTSKQANKQASKQTNKQTNTHFSHYLTALLDCSSPSGHQAETLIFFRSEQADGKKKIKMAISGPGRWTRCYGCYRHAFTLSR